MTAPAPMFCVVADDEPRLRQVLVRLMTSDGFTCLEAADGVEALEKLASVPAALLLSDLRMPRMDGLELLRQARAKYPDLAVILITAVADVELALSCLANGAMDYLTKPFHLEEVLARVGQAMEKRRLILENRDYQTGLERLVAMQARRLEELFLGGVQALVQALEVKDQYTKGHSIRVSQYSSLLAREIGLPESTVRDIELGGQVHDIGKIGVREAVLNKEGPLTDEEYQHIMTHPMLGWQILSPLLGDTPVALSIVRSHHERFDGRGIPDKLAGTNIPIEARIAGVADAFDAMTSGRAYRRGRIMSADDAVAEITRCAGAQFDPELAAAFVNVIRREKLGS
ncbi:MAG: HD domain-containing phosphohydrolase [Gemmatimonadaceae bacterium]